MRLVRFMSVISLTFSISAYCMEGDGLLQEVRDWYSTGKQKPSDDGWTPCKTAQPVSEVQCLQRLFEHWTPGVKEADKKKEEEREKRRIKRMNKRGRKKETKKQEREDLDFLEQEAAKQNMRRELEENTADAEAVLNAFRVKHYEQAEQSRSGLFHSEEMHKGVLFQVIYNGCAWYLFDGRYEGHDRAIVYGLETLQENAIQKKNPGLSLQFCNDCREVYLFAGKTRGPTYAFQGLLAVVTHQGGGKSTRGFIVSLIRALKREHSNSPIKPKVRNGAGDKKKAIHEKRLAQLRELQRCAVPDGQRNRDHKP